MNKIIVLLFLSILIFEISAGFKSKSLSNFNRNVNQDPKVSLGQALFFDTNLSNPIGQSCGSCHAHKTALSDSLHRAEQPGAINTIFGNRNAPSLTYAKYIPPLTLEVNVYGDSTFSGGLFWDGRANTLEDQAAGPLLNPLEMNNPNKGSVVNKVKKAQYYPLYVSVYGSITDTVNAFSNIQNALATFERNFPNDSSFTSKFDYYLKGEYTFSPQELNGFMLFNDPAKGNCTFCHTLTPDSATGKIFFTDFSYDMATVPKNPNNPFYYMSAQFNPAGVNYIDLGIGEIQHSYNQNGLFRIPTLRNVEVTAPYFHNGFSATLEDLVHFYNVRWVDSSFAKPEYINYNTDLLSVGALGLSTSEEADLVAFLKTLTDGYCNCKCKTMTAPQYLK